MKIALLAKGKYTLPKFPGNEHFDQVWGLNQLAQTHELDRCYVMDDLKFRQSFYDGPEFGEWLKGYEGRVITSREYEEWPTAEAYPLVEVAKFFGLPLGVAFYGTVDYMLAAAAYEGVKEVHMYGVDCIDPGFEKVRCSIAVWLGAVMSRGVKIKVQHGSIFNWWTETGIGHEQGLYGYTDKPPIETLV